MVECGHIHVGGGGGGYMKRIAFSNDHGFQICRCKYTDMSSVTCAARHLLGTLDLLDVVCIPAPPVAAAPGLEFVHLDELPQPLPQQFLPTGKNGY